MRDFKMLKWHKFKGWVSIRKGLGRAANKCYPHDGHSDYQYYLHDGRANCSSYSQNKKIYNLVLHIDCRYQFEFGPCIVLSTIVWKANIIGTTVVGIANIIGTTVMWITKIIGTTIVPTDTSISKYKRSVYFFVFTCLIKIPVDHSQQKNNVPWSFKIPKGWQFMPWSQGVDFRVPFI